ncbi:MAG: LSM domain-containing protein [Nitrososphaerales archaeon]
MLVDAQEFSKGVLSAQFGKVVIRGNNVLFIKFEDDI